MMMSFAYLCQFGYGWSLTLSFAFIQLGVEQVELGVAGALAYVISANNFRLHQMLTYIGPLAVGLGVQLHHRYTQLFSPTQ